MTLCPALMMWFNHGRKLLTVSGLALALNLIWEFSHYRLYNDWTGIPPVPHLLLASFTDALIITAIFFVISWVHRGTRWLLRPNRLDYGFIVGCGLAIAAAMETWATTTGRWTYRAAMPTVAGLGLSPLVQLVTTGILTLWIYRLSQRHHQPNNKP